MARPRLRVINGTCLEVAEEFQGWVESQGIELVANREVNPYNVEEVIEGCGDFDGIIGPFYCLITSNFFEALPRLKVLSLASSGYDAIEDPMAASRAGVVITWAPVREGAEVVADMTWGLLLATVRRIPQHYQLLQEGHYGRSISPSVYDKTLGILGLGNIGKAVARRAIGFDMEVIACDTNPDMEFIRHHKVQLVSFEDLLSRSDFLSVHLRLTRETQNIIGKEELSLMKPAAYLVNTARVELVNETHLLEALEQGVIAGAAIDEVPRIETDRLLNHPNCICTPHLGNRAIEGIRAVTRGALENAIEVLHGNRPTHVLNPEVYD